MMRRVSAFLLALAVVLTLGAVAQSDPGTGTRVPTLDEFNALEARVTTLETRPTPTVTVTPTPTPTATETPTQTPTSTPTSPSPTVTPTTSPTTLSPTATPTAAAFPDTASTGDPSTADNTTYTGPMTVSTSGTVINNKTITGALNITGSNVVIRNSTITGYVYFQAGQTGGLIEDSTVDNRGHDGAGVNYYNFTARRVEVTGGRVSISCAENCTVVDSWLHGQQTQGSWHGDGFLSNGGDRITLRHNTLACDGPATGTGACSAAVALYGDFDPITNVIVADNLFKASPAGYCMYGGYDTQKPYGARASNIDVTGNVFERGANGKCAVYGPVANAAYDAASTWSGNRWSDGTTLNR